jgi:hypothetical protein
MCRSYEAYPAGIPRTALTAVAILVAAFGVVVFVGAGLALAFDYVSVLALAPVWALVAAGLSLYADPPGGRRVGRAVLWAVAALLLGGLPIVLLAWRIGTRRTRVYEPNVSR